MENYNANAMFPSGLKAEKDTNTNVKNVTSSGCSLTEESAPYNYQKIFLCEKDWNNFEKESATAPKQHFGMERLLQEPSIFD